MCNVDPVNVSVSLRKVRRRAAASHAGPIAAAFSNSTFETSIVAFAAETAAMLLLLIGFVLARAKTRTHHFGFFPFPPQVRPSLLGAQSDSGAFFAMRLLARRWRASAHKKISLKPPKRATTHAPSPTTFSGTQKKFPERNLPDTDFHFFKERSFLPLETWSDLTIPTSPPRSDATKLGGRHGLRASSTRGVRRGGGGFR